MKPLISNFNIDLFNDVDEEEESEEEEGADDDGEGEEGADYAVEEEEVSEDETEEGMIGDMESLKALNKEYSNQLKSVLSKLELKLTMNQIRQVEIEEEISNLEIEEEGGPQQDRAQGLLIFTAPYFKDKNGFQPPANTDTKIKTGFSQELPVWLPLQPKKFSEEDQAKLKVSVKQEALHTRKSKLLQEIDKVSMSSLDPDQETPSERLADLRLELREVENSAEEVLLADRYESYDWEKISGDHSPSLCRLQ